MGHIINYIISYYNYETMPVRRMITLDTPFRIFIDEYIAAKEYNAHNSQYTTKKKYIYAPYLNLKKGYVQFTRGTVKNKNLIPFPFPSQGQRTIRVFNESTQV